MRALRNVLVATVAAFACLPLSACAEEASFEQGFTGVELPYWTGEGAAWSPDGSWLAIPIKSGIRLRNVSSGATREIAAPALQGFPEDPGRISWSADGRTLRYVTKFGPREGNFSWLTEIRRDGSGLRQAPLPVRAQTLDWGPAGLPLAFTTGAYFIDGDKGLPGGPKPALYVVDGIDAEPRRIVHAPDSDREADIVDPQFSPDGERIFYKRFYRHRLTLWSVRPDGSAPRRVIRGLSGAQRFSLSPDGGRIALKAFFAGQRREGLYVAGVDGRRIRPVSDEEIVDGPVWSPDGRWLTFSTYEGEIRRVRPNGRGEGVIAELPGQEIRGLLWSPDGRRLAYTARDFPRSD
jgi:Tol biopolymer transport system component